MIQNVIDGWLVFDTSVRRFGQHFHLATTVLANIHIDVA
jgi:hypothetical protein